MSRNPGEVDKNEIARWVDEQVHRGIPAYARGYQGQVYRYEHRGRKLIVKTAMGPTWLAWLRRAALRREHAIYQHLAGYPGSPHCFGFFCGRYLVLEYINGTSLRDATLIDRDAYFAALFDRIQELHRRGVAHADLKRKDNLMVVNGREPMLIDFGVAIARKPGFAPINRYLFNLARQFDLNAWVKLKYRGKLDRISATDRPYYHMTRVERIAKRLRPGFQKLRSWLTSPRDPNT